MRYLILLISALLIFSCHKHDHDEDHDHDHKDDKHHGHAHDEDGNCVHEAPNGGSMISYGNDFAFIEFLLDNKTGTMTAFIYAGHSVTPQKIKDETITLNLASGEEKNQLILKPEVSELTKNKVGDSSKFVGQSDWLKGKEKFDIWVEPVTIKGVKQKQVHFVFPDASKAHTH